MRLDRPKDRSELTRRVLLLLPDFPGCNPDIRMNGGVHRGQLGIPSDRIAFDHGELAGEYREAGMSVALDPRFQEGIDPLACSQLKILSVGTSRQGNERSGNEGAVGM